MSGIIPQNHELQLIFHLIFAMALGWLIGWERKHWKKPAGGRTFMLISLGSCLFTIISVEGARMFSQGASIDPLRIASNVLTGIGFIGAGLILHHEERVEGVTSAAALWVAAAVGMSVAFHFYTLAIVTALLTVTGLNLSYATRKFYSHVSQKEHGAEGEDI
ncbi:MAG: MgtC/SapB family protein [bacterium]|nr:MgtC/SapB family protein [bacterium]